MLPAQLGIIEAVRIQRWLLRRGRQTRQLPGDLEHPVLALHDFLDSRRNGLVELQLLHATLLVLRDDFLSREFNLHGGDMKHILAELTADVEHLMGIAQHVQRDAFIRLLLPLAAHRPDFLQVLPFRAAAQTAIRRRELRRMFLGDMGADNDSGAAFEPDSLMTPTAPMRCNKANSWQQRLRRGHALCVQPSSVVKPGSSPGRPLSSTVGDNTLKADMEDSHGKVKPSQVRRPASMPASGINRRGMDTSLTSPGLTAGWTAQIKKKKALVPIQAPDTGRPSDKCSARLSHATTSLGP
jgi:hypothetical protein